MCVYIQKLYWENTSYFSVFHSLSLPLSPQSYVIYDRQCCCCYVHRWWFCVRAARRYDGPIYVRGHIFIHTVQYCLFKEYIRFVSVLCLLPLPPPSPSSPPLLMCYYKNARSTYIYIHFYDYFNLSFFIRFLSLLSFDSCLVFPFLLLRLAWFLFSTGSPDTFSFYYYYYDCNHEYNGMEIICSHAYEHSQFFFI